MAKKNELMTVAGLAKRMADAVEEELKQIAKDLLVIYKANPEADFFAENQEIADSLKGIKDHVKVRAKRGSKIVKNQAASAATETKKNEPASQADKGKEKPSEVRPKRQLKPGQVSAEIDLDNL